jgi:hypothetical protein
MLPFLTAYDPLGGSSGSIDPLGALRTYGALADLLLPGVTTITTRSRYLSMLCAALANAEKHHTYLPGASGLASRRKAVEPFERLWALGCVAAHHDGVSLAADGLRGITYAEDSYQRFVQKKKVSPDFKLLKYQSRTGAVGTYWTALIGGELVHADTGSLAYEGLELAKEFPEPPLTAKDSRLLAQPEAAHRVSMSLDDLVEWSGQCHLVAAGKVEREQLGDALTANDRRDFMARALQQMTDASALPETWDTESLQQLRDVLSMIEAAAHLGLPTVIDAVVVTERFHEATLAAFQILLWWGTQNANHLLDSLLAEASAQQAIERVRETALALRQFREACDRPEIREAITGLAAFAYTIDHATSPKLVVDEILHRHHQVQSGKVDGGAPKRDWISCESGKLLRPSPRFQRNEPPPLAIGRELTHPYRLEPFIYMLRENGVLPRPGKEEN